MGMGCMNKGIMTGKIDKNEKPALGPVWEIGEGRGSHLGGRRRGVAPGSDLFVDKSH
jgi:hypothetical protein